MGAKLAGATLKRGSSADARGGASGKQQGKARGKAAQPAAAAGGRAAAAGAASGSRPAAVPAAAAPAAAAAAGADSDASVFEAEAPPPQAAKRVRVEYEVVRPAAAAANEGKAAGKATAAGGKAAAALPALAPAREVLDVGPWAGATDVCTPLGFERFEREMARAASCSIGLLCADPSGAQFFRWGPHGAAGSCP